VDFVRLGFEPTRRILEEFKKIWSKPFFKTIWEDRWRKSRGWIGRQV